MSSGVALSGGPAGPPLSLAARETPHTALELVAHVAGQLGENLELDQILGEIAHAGRALLDIDRVSIFTLDGDYLRPAVSVSRVADDHLWATFRTMPPVSLDLSKEARILLARGRAVQIDARVSPVVPPEWRRTFALTNLAIVPLRGANSVCGVLIGDSSDPARARLTPEQLHALETVSSLAGLVLERHEHAMASLSQTADLLAVTRALAEADTAAEIATAAAVGLRNVFGASSASVALIADEGSVEVAGHAGDLGGMTVDWPEVAAACLDAHPSSGHVVIGSEGDAMLVGGLDGAHLVVAGRLAGASNADAGCRQRAFLVLDQIRHAIRRHRSQTAESLARQRLGEVTAFAAAATALGPLASLVDRLAPPLRTVADAELLDLVVHPGARARALGLRAPTSAEARRIVAWRNGTTTPAPVTAAGRCLVPLVSGGAVLGAMVVRVTAQSDVEALGHASALIGPVVEAAALRRELEEHRHRADALEERLRIESKSFRTAAERLDTAMAMLRVGPGTPAQNGVHRSLDVGRVQELVRDATIELTSTQQASAAAWSARSGFVGKVRALARGVSRPDFEVVVRAAAGVADLEVPHAAALVLATHEILRLASVVRASQAVVRIGCDLDRLTVEVRANGRLALADGLGGTAAHVLLRDIQRQLEPLGTRVELSNGGTWFVVKLRTAQAPTEG